MRKEKRDMLDDTGYYCLRELVQRMKTIRAKCFLSKKEREIKLKLQLCATIQDKIKPDRSLEKISFLYF